jgi:hypothetical protein
MFGLLLLILRRSFRNGPLTLAVLVGLLVLVTLLVAAPLYTAALADVGLRATLADAPLDERSVRVALPADTLDEAEYRALGARVEETARAASWLNPDMLPALRTKRLVLPEGESDRRVVLVEADDALPNVRVVEGRLPAAVAAPAPVEVVLGLNAAEQFGLAVGDTVDLLERRGGEPLVPITVVGLVEPADSAATFWQSGVLDLEPIVSATRREAMLLLATGASWQRVVPQLPAERRSGEYRWRIVFDTTLVNGDNALASERAIREVLDSTARAMPDATVESDFSGIVSDYRQRLSIARAPILLLLSEIAGLALIYIAWTAAFQAEATAGEQAVMAARGAGVRQLVSVTGGQAALLALGAALSGIPLALLLLRATANIGPVAALARAQGLRLQATPDAGTYAIGASLIGLLTLALPAIPAARRSIIALRQGAARPAGTPLWQRTYLDVFVAVVAIIALVQLQVQGSVLQRLRGTFVVDPFLVVAPLLVLVAGALLFLRLYPLLLHAVRSWSVSLQGLPVALALIQLSRNRAASTRLVLLLSLAVALGLFAQTFGATVALNQRQRAGYAVGADARATLTNLEPLLPGALPAGVRGAWAMRDTVKAAGGRGANGTLLALDPAHFEAVAFNPPERPVAPVGAVLQSLGESPPPDGIAVEGQPRQISLVLRRGGAPFIPAVVVSDVAGRYHRYRMTTSDPDDGVQTYTVTLNLPAAAYPVRVTALAFLPDGTVRWGFLEDVKPPVSFGLGPLAADAQILDRWDGAHGWEASSDTPLNPDQPAAGTATLETVEGGFQTLTVEQGRGMRAATLLPDMEEVTPIPAHASPTFLAANNLAVGDTALFLFRNRLVPIEIRGQTDYFPSLGIDAEPFMVAHGPRLLRALNASYSSPVTPNELWLDMPDDPAALAALDTTSGIGTVLEQNAVLRSFSRDPLAVGVAGVFFLGFVVSIGLTALGFAIATYLAGRRRTVEFAVLQALGLERRAVLGIIAIEQAVLVVLALLAGTALGVALGRLVLPFMAVSDQGRATVPPYEIAVPWGSLAWMYALLIALFVGMTIVVLWLLLRRGIGNALRIGEE